MCLGKDSGVESRDDGGGVRTLPGETGAGNPEDRSGNARGTSEGHHGEHDCRGRLDNSSWGTKLE